MIVNRFAINLNTFLSSSATTINVPITVEHQLVDNSDLIENVFVETETQKAINPIIDYERVRFTPKTLLNNGVSYIKYVLNTIDNDKNALPLTHYSDIGFIDSDIRFKKNYFTKTYLSCQFFDSDIALNQNLVTSLTIYTMLTADDIYPIKSTDGIPGRTKPASQIPVRFVLSNPVTNPEGVAEGYSIYDYKSDFKIGYPKYLYMRASFNNAKTGKAFNLMTEGQAFPIDILVNKLYTRYILYRDQTGFYYQIDDKYSSNVKYTEALNDSSVEINLYPIQVL
jgi:hypothetical protein